MSLICLFVAIMHKGSDATCMSQIKAVILNKAYFLPVPRSHNHGLLSFVWLTVFCILHCFAILLYKKSFTCCQPLGTSPELEHFEMPPSSSATVRYTKSPASLSQGHSLQVILCFPTFGCKAESIVLNSCEDVPYQDVQYCL